MPIFIKLSENICLQDKLTAAEVDSCPIKILLKKLIKKNIMLHLTGLAEPYWLLFQAKKLINEEMNIKKRKEKRQ